MVNYGLKDKVALITGANNPQGIGATTALPSIVLHQVPLRRDGLTPIWNSQFFLSFLWVN